MSTASSVVPQIVLTDEQVAAIRSAKGNTVELRTIQGERLGIASILEEGEFAGWTAEDIAIAKARSAMKRDGLTIDQVMERLRAQERQ